MLHHPVLSNKSSWNNASIRLMMEPILSQYPVDLVLQGHEHGYARNSKKDKSGTSKLSIYVTSHLSKKLYPSFKATKITDAIIPNTALFQHIKVDNNILTLYSYTLQGEKVDSVSIVK